MDLYTSFVSFFLHPYPHKRSLKLVSVIPAVSFFGFGQCTIPRLLEVLTYCRTVCDYMRDHILLVFIIVFRSFFLSLVDWHISGGSFLFFLQFQVQLFDSFAVAVVGVVMYGT